MVRSRVFPRSGTLRVFSLDTRLTLLCTAVLLTLMTAGRVNGQEPQTGSVNGTVADTSAGVLPGVVVSAIAADGRTLSTTVTSGDGGFSFGHLPAGTVDLVFHLDGFKDAKVSVTVAPGGAGATTVKQQMELKGLTESVVVRADLPPEPTAPPRPVLQHVPEHDPSAVCGPAKAEGIASSLHTIWSRRDQGRRGLFASGDELVIDGGANAGFRAGDNFIVRRRYPTPLLDKKKKPVMGEHSSGLVQIVSVDDETSTAAVVYACDEMMPGDYLVRFEPEPPTLPDPVGAPSFDTAARILFGDAGQVVGTTNRMLVIDRGTLGGVDVGQRFTIFRRSTAGHARPLIVAEAVVVSTRRDSATIRVERATDVVFLGLDGDWAAPHRPSPLQAQR